MNIDYSENLKIKFNKNENELSFNKNLNDNKILLAKFQKKIFRLDLLKQIIEARVDEIIELSVIKIIII